VIIVRPTELVINTVARLGSKRCRVLLKDVNGWWPKGARDRSTAAMRSVTA
jgi:hypothetical protein